MVKDRYSTHCEMIALLCKPEKELSDAIPSANPMKTLQGSEVSPSRPQSVPVPPQSQGGIFSSHSLVGGP